MYTCTLYKWKFKGTACGYITHVLPFVLVLHKEILELQNRILVSVNIKLQAITSGNDNSFPRSLEGAGTSQLYHSLYSVWDCTALGL